MTAQDESLKRIASYHKVKQDDAQSDCIMFKTFIFTDTSDSRE